MPLFRPERFVISNAVARELDARGLAISRIVHHPDGSAELVLAPREAHDDGLVEVETRPCPR